MANVNISTLDLDGYSKSQLDGVIDKISHCSYFKELYWRESASGNGYHVRIECHKLQCPLCRLVFDSDFRYMLDSTQRKPHQRNVLWRVKTYEKFGRTIALNVGEWHRPVRRRLFPSPYPDKSELVGA